MTVRLDQQLAEIRKLGERYLSGTRDSFSAAEELFQKLLSATVMADGERVRLTQGVSPDDRVLAGRGLRPVKLRNGKYLRVMTSLRLFLHDESASYRMKVVESNFQFQSDPDFPSQGGEIFRYDYVREPKLNADGTPHLHPLAHLNIHAALPGDVLPAKTPMARIHFPTGRVSLEAVIRCLADQFKVDTRYTADVWRPMLSCSEEMFLKVAHQPESGPDT